MSIFGENLSPATRLWSLSEFNGPKMPTSLDGVSVTVRGVPAPVQFTSPEQINFQVPDGALPSVFGDWVDLTVTTPVGSDTPRIFISREAPGIFVFANGDDIAALHSDGVPVAESGSIENVETRPALPGEVIEIYGTGFGPTDPPVPSGEIYSGGAKLDPQTGLEISLGGIVAEWEFAGQSAAGLNQFNVIVPIDLPPGKHRLQIRLNRYPAITNATIAVGAQ